MKKLMLLIMLFITVNIYSQETFIINDDLGHFVNIGYMVSESEDSYHIIGMTIENDTVQVTPFVLNINKDGKYATENYSIYKDTSTTMFMNLNNKKYLYEDEVEFGVSTLEGKYIMRYNTKSNSLYRKDSFSFLNPRDTFIRHFIPFGESYLLCGNAISLNEEDVKDFIILDMNTNSNIVIRGEDNFGFQYCQRVLMASDSTYFGIASTNISGNGMRTIEIIHFNDQGDLLNRIITNISSYGIEDAIIDANDNILISHYNFLKLNQDTLFDLGLFNPSLLKVNKDGINQWDKSYGEHLNDSGQISKYASVIESVELDGYIVVGSDYIRGNDLKPKSYATITKISSAGDSLWYRKYATIDTIENFFHVFNDVIATQDGGYLAVGDETYWDVEENRTSQSLLIVKTDSNGLVEPDTTSSVVTITNTPQFEIYPNPTTDYLYINKETTDIWSVSVMDMSGKEMLTEKLDEGGITYLMDLKMFPSGTYVLSFNNGHQVFSERVVVSH